MNRVQYKPSLSSLPLQMSLYYNGLLSVIFSVVVGSCSVYKYLYYNKRVSISVILFWTFLEPFRLYYGYKGNMSEKVPELATYLLITLFPQIPFVLYLSYVQPVKFPVDPILGSFMLVFLVIEFILGLNSVHEHIKSQTAQFMRLCEE